MQRITVTRDRSSWTPRYPDLTPTDSGVGVAISVVAAEFALCANVDQRSAVTRRNELVEGIGRECDGVSQ